MIKKIIHLAIVLTLLSVKTIASWAFFIHPVKSVLPDVSLQISILPHFQLDQKLVD
jgi:hypothetical protein